MLLQFFKKERRRSLFVFPSESLESLQRLFFYFLKAAKENRYQKTVHGKAISQNGGLRVKVPSWFLFTAEEKFIDILKEKFRELL